MDNGAAVKASVMEALVTSTHVQPRPLKREIAAALAPCVVLTPAEAKESRVAIGEAEAEIKRLREALRYASEGWPDAREVARQALGDRDD